MRVLSFRRNTPSKPRSLLFPRSRFPPTRQLIDTGPKKRRPEGQEKRLIVQQLRITDPFCHHIFLSGNFLMNQLEPFNRLSVFLEKWTAETPTVLVIFTQNRSRG